MKIAVVTMHYANNYGALLQAYALQKILNEEMGADAECLAYFPVNYNRSWKPLNKPRNLREAARIAYLLLHPVTVRKMKKRSSKNAEFIAKNIRRSKPYHSEKEILEDRLDYDAYICGSDQVWNRRLRKEAVFFLNFTARMPGVKKIAYAPSVAEDVPLDEVELVRSYLKNIDAISVRERKDVQIIQALTDKPVRHVADPVFLVTVDEWRKRSIKPMLDKPYILCYFIGSGKDAVRAVQKLKGLTGYMVVHVNVNVLDKFHSDLCVWDADPFEFVGYIENAAIICTNSFHGTAFSAIFRKNYVVIPNSIRNSRMESIHQTLGIKDRFVYPNEIDTLTVERIMVDYSGVEKRLNAFREASLSYLEEELGVCR